MSKWADYAISGVKYSDNHISHVWLKEDLGDSLSIGKLTTKDNVIALIKQGKTVVTTKWNYHKANWSKGVAVGYYKSSLGGEYLRTHPDYTDTDNLENMLDLRQFSI